MLAAAPGAEVGLSPEQWRQLGAAVRRVHSVPTRPLTRLVAREAFRQVLCHGDLHTWNVLVDTDQHLWIVDWDEAILAPRERDLMFVVGGVGHGLVGPDDTDSFLRGYGETRIDPLLLAYYRCAWAVQDIAAYGEEVLTTPTLGQESRRAAVDGFKDLFEPGNIVELASR